MEQRAEDNSACSDQPEKTFSIGELARAAGISRRSVRFYVQRELLPPPIGKGRGSSYDLDHLRRLQQIDFLSRQGLSLEQIKQHLDAPKQSAPATEYTLVKQMMQQQAQPSTLVLRVQVLPGLVLECDPTRFDEQAIERLAAACLHAHETKIQDE